jgi:ABC-type multidrug transport system fused ATPase/permease subunit
MLLRFYNPDSGRIMIGGRDIKEYNIKSLRSQFGLVSQEPVLFAKSILENIRYGRDDATDEDCMMAARRSNAEEFILTQPEQWQTNVGPRGSRLSGGQKQRIAIARALLRNPKVLLLDEATSALDNESERVVQAALEELMIGRTTIIVAHRLSTIRTADLIVVLDRGQVSLPFFMAHSHVHVVSPAFRIIVVASVVMLAVVDYSGSGNRHL